MILIIATVIPGVFMKKCVVISLLLALAVSCMYSQEQGEKRVLRIGHGTRAQVDSYYDSQLVREACTRAGFTMVLVEAPFRRILDMAEHGLIDAVCNALKTDERESFELEGQQNRNRSRFFSYSPDFDRLVASGSIRSVEAFATVPLALMLLHGRLSLIIENPISLACEVRDIPGFWDQVSRMYPPVASQPAYVAFSRASPAAMSAMEAFDSALSSMKKDGTWQETMKQANAAPLTH